MGYWTPCTSADVGQVLILGLISHVYIVGSHGTEPGHLCLRNFLEFFLDFSLRGLCLHGRHLEFNKPLSAATMNKVQLLALHKLTICKERETYTQVITGQSD